MCVSLGWSLRSMCIKETDEFCRTVLWRTTIWVILQSTQRRPRVLSIMPKIRRNFGRNSNGKVRFSFFRPEYSESLLEVVLLFRSEYSDRNSALHFWQTAGGSLPYLGNSKYFHYTKDYGNFSRNSNGKVRFGFSSPEYWGSPIEVRGDWGERHRM